MIWRKLSLRTRLNLLFALVLVLSLCINIGRLLLEAGPRIQAEDDSVVRLAREFIETSVADLKDGADAEGKLAAIVNDLQRLRHVSVTRENSDAPSGGQPARLDPVDSRFDAPPDWFIRLVRPEQKTVRVPISVAGQSRGTLLIASHPTDEIAEIWDGIVTQVEVGSALAVAWLLIMIAVVNRALAPLQSLASAMASIEAGQYNTRVAPTGSSEIATICDKLNHLASTLGEAMDDKRRLAERVVSLQDVERKEIARELHDEFGPYLFALRAHATSLMRMAELARPDMEGLRNHGNAMLEQINALQQFNRRVLDRLRPAGLSELGLGAALDALVRLWRNAYPAVVVETTISQPLGAIGETAELTIYRVVQEALTNAFRHSGATRVDVTIASMPAGLPSGGSGNSKVIRVCVCDNGSGLSADHKHGLGLTGMRERVMALGGTMTVTSANGGVRVEATVPNGASA